MLGALAKSARFAMGVHGIMREVLTPRAAEEAIASRFAAREDAFLALLEKAIFGRPTSVYRRLLLHAGFGFDDVRLLVREIGLEASLERLYEAGVYVTAEEFKGRRPIRRSGLELAVSASDFDNPLADASFEGHTSGSTGNATPVFIGFDLMEHDAAYYACLYSAFGIAQRPLGFWHAALHTGLKNLLRHLRRGSTPRRWFTSIPPSHTWHGWKDEQLVLLTILVGLLHGKWLPRRKFVSRKDPEPVTRWLAENTSRGRPAVLETNPSQAVRLCLAAKEHGLDISGTVFHLTGEPFTKARAAVIESAGASAIDRYSNVEVAAMGIACADPASFDDQHFLGDKLAMILQEKALPGAAAPVQAMVLTSLSPATPKLMLNVESGDYARVSERDCGCPLGRIGLRTHLSEVRAYDKLTSDGVTFQARDIFGLLEEVLPSRFGGEPTDYQLVEMEAGGLPEVLLVVRPSVGEVDESEVARTAYAALRSASPGMTREWLEGSLLKVVRREPFETGSAKILPLHVLRESEERAAISP
jgi:phenylacetate-coenzyme A ligase PaaK-like adenylate-forming protein